MQSRKKTRSDWREELVGNVQASIVWRLSV